MFLDNAKIHVKSGAGGNGMVAWRREKYVPFGGPAGGDGGKGGDVYLEATEDLSTLLDFKYQSIFKAEDGEKGGPKNCHGRDGKEVIIRVPCGTIVRDIKTGLAIADLTQPGDRILIAAGGRGGRGNSRFTSSVRQSPQFCEPGEPGIERELELELKLIADIGIIGLPNAGKSTLISVISAAKPKIADYPFTTLAPNLGVVRKPNGDGIVVADIPGLIEGASEGLGLGHDFLRHIERTRLLVHLIDGSGLMTHDGEHMVIENYHLINRELQKYSRNLAQKPQIVALSKIDAVAPEQLVEIQKQLESICSSPVSLISSVSGQGIPELIRRMLDQLSQLPAQEESIVPLAPDLAAFDHDDSAYEIHKKGRVWSVLGGKVERLISVTDMKNRAALFRCMNILKAMGIFDALAQAGAKEGDIVAIAGNEFDYLPDDEGSDDMETFIDE